MKNLAIYMLCIMALAVFSALYDHWKMLENKRKGEEKDLQHVTRWVFRFIFAIATAYFLDTFVFLLFSWALFNLCFRPILNALNTKDPRYIAPWGNNYDLLGFTFAVGHDIPDKLWDIYVKEGSRIYHSQNDYYKPKATSSEYGINVDLYRDKIHSGGSILYLVEASVAMLGVITYLLVIHFA